MSAQANGPGLVEAELAALKGRPKRVGKRNLVLLFCLGD
jgi:hypothetical protein